MKTTLFKTLLGLLLFLNTGLALAQAWIPIGQPGFPAAHFPFLVLDNNNVPYIFYKDYSDNNKGVVMSFQNGEWEHLGSPYFSHQIFEDNGLSDGWYSTHTIVMNNNIPYVAYINSSQGISVMKYDNNYWQFVGEMNISSGVSRFISLVFDSNNITYISYLTYSNSSIVVKKFVNDSWETVTEIPFSVEVHNSLLAIDTNDNPYLAYVTREFMSDSYSISVKKYENEIWQDVGNIITGCENPLIGFVLDSQNIPYVAYTDKENDNNITVKKNEMDDWQTLGNMKPLGNFHWFFSLVVDYNDVPYLSYTNEIIDPSLTMTAIVKQYENGSWQTVGETDNYVGAPSIAVDNENILYGIFSSIGEPFSFLSTVMKFDPTASVEVSVFDEVKMYPNPTSGLFYIETSKEIQSYEVYNLIGQQLLKGSFTDSIDMKDISKGTYIIRLTTPTGEVFTEKVIKE
jgi:hypothetical protein